MVKDKRSTFEFSRVYLSIHWLKSKGVRSAPRTGAREVFTEKMWKQSKEVMRLATACLIGEKLVGCLGSVVLRLIFSYSRASSPA